jgi:hypothetical protein
MGKTREELEADIKRWEGINKYIVEDARAKIKLLDEPIVAKKEPDKKVEEVVVEKPRLIKLKKK